MQFFSNEIIQQKKTWSFNRCTSTGITDRIGKGSTKTFGRDRCKQFSAEDHLAPSKKSPVT